MRAARVVVVIAATAVSLTACGSGKHDTSNSGAATQPPAARPAGATIAAGRLKACVASADLHADSRTITNPTRAVEITVESADRIESAIVFDVYPSPAAAQRNLSDLESTVQGLASDGTTPPSHVERTRNVLFVYATRTPPALLSRLRSCLR